MIARLVYGILLGLVGAVVVHLSIVFLMPAVSTSTAWVRVASEIDTGNTAELWRPNGSNAPKGASPFERVLACRYDLDEGVMQFLAEGRSPLWSISVHDASGQILFSANDRIVGRDRIDVAIANDRQLRTLRQELPVDFTDSILVTAPGNDGFVLFRVMEFDNSMTPMTDEFFASAECMHLGF